MKWLASVKSLRSKRLPSHEYADFTISRIDPAVRAAMPQEHLTAVREALIAQNESSRHSLDIRFTVPLFFARYYFVILGGRDRRQKTRSREKQRISFANLVIGTILFASISLLVLTLLWLAIFLAAYLFKVDSGIDLLANFHLMDLFQRDE